MNWDKTFVMVDVAVNAHCRQKSIDYCICRRTE